MGTKGKAMLTPIAVCLLVMLAFVVYLAAVTSEWESISCD